jgi:tetratricopeptide (TPR) repeat protein
VSGDRYQGFVFVPAELAEDVDLPVELRKEILWLHARLDELDRWALLGVPWNAPVDQVRDAYLARVKVFHPDRHPGKRLGAYRARMERVFRALTEARDLLQDPVRRAAYVRSTAPPEELARLQVRDLESEKRADERRARLARQNPLLARAARTQEFLARGRRAFEEGRWQQALNDFQMVVSLDERHAEGRRLAEEARSRLASARAAEAFETGLKAELAGQPQTALALFREAHEADPQNPRFAVAASRASLAVGDVAGAREAAEHAARAAPRDGAAQQALALALLAAGLGKEARKAAERALELDPGLAEAKALVKRLRWSILG